ncbi:MAG TPA: zf-HC2 domain-containing protein [Acidimicrobiia bacterium]|jgi:anti-sigma factor RsiW
MTEPRDDLPEELLSAYVDGELTVDERAAVDVQLATSQVWSQLLGEITEVRAAVRSLPVPLAPAGFWESVLLDDPAVTPSRLRVPHPLRWVAGSAAAAVVAVAFVVPSHHTTTPPVATMVDAHASRSSLSQDPVTQLAPIAQPVKLAP